MQKQDTLVDAQKAAVRGVGFRSISRLLTTRRMQPLLFLAPALFTLLLVGVFPTIQAFRLSLQEYNLLKPQEVHFIGLANYIALVRDGRFYHSLWVQVQFTVVGVGAELVFGLAIALFLHRPFRGKQLVRTLILLPMLLSPVAVALMWRIFYNGDAGIVNYFLSFLGIPPQPWLGQSSTALWAVVATDVWQWTPFITLIALAGLESLPDEPFEAAAIDGASRWQTFRYLTLPMLMPLLTVGMIMRGIDSVRTFDLIYIMTSGGPGKLTETANFLVYLTGFKFFHIGYGTTMALVLTILITTIATQVIGRSRNWDL